MTKEQHWCGRCDACIHFDRLYRQWHAGSWYERYLDSQVGRDRALMQAHEERWGKSP